MRIACTTFSGTAPALRGGASFALLTLLTFLASGRAAAHFGPAEAPDFGVPECITVVDLRTSSELPLSYQLGYDDTEPELGHIFLPDSKTHSFFAFRGAVVPEMMHRQYLAFAGGPALLLPLWIDSDDLQRADAAKNDSTAPDFDAAKIGENVLHARTDLAGEWLEIATTPARVPITVEQADRGLTWNLSGVPAGVYQVVGYVFSPPFNTWEPRPGVIKLIDGTVDTPAVTFDSIDGMIYAGQGRRITGCIDTPAGSTLSASFRVDGSAADDWRPWLSDMPVASGALDLCFKSPDPALAGLIHLRVAVTAPAGEQTFAYTTDALVLFDTEAACTASESQCCEATAMPAPPPMTETPPMVGKPASGKPEPAAPAAPAAATESPHARPAQGCAVSPWMRAEAAHPRVLTLLFALSALALQRLRRKRM